MNNSIGIPWVSFCLATYRRPEILVKTLTNIQQQDFSNFEVIVSDNDPEQSSRWVVEGLADKRFHYYSNVENVGMVKNFNIALSHAQGEYVVLLADDDPPYHNFLSIIRDIWEQHPNYGAYYGACEVLIESEDAAIAYQREIGKVKCLAPVADGEVRFFSREEYPEKYFTGAIFPYILWSTGIVRKDIVLKMGGMPDYGSPLLTDISFVAVAGSYSGCATINKILGGQTVHGANSGLVNPHNIEIALQGCYKYLVNNFSRQENWTHLQLVMDKFLYNYVASHCVAMDRLFARTGDKAQRQELRKTLQVLSGLPYMKGIQHLFYRLWLIKTIKKIPFVKYAIRPIRLISKYLLLIKKRLQNISK